MMKGAGPTLSNANLMDNDFLVLADQDEQKLRLLELSSGRILFEIPATPDDTQLSLNQGDLVIEERGKGLSVWDLGKGLNVGSERIERQRW